MSRIVERGNTFEFSSIMKVETIALKIVTGQTKLEGDIRKRTIPNFIEACRSKMPKEDRGEHFYASILTAIANNDLALGEQKTFSDEKEREQRKGTQYVLTPREETYVYCRSKIERIKKQKKTSKSNVPSLIISPQQLFRNFALIEECMQEFSIINESKVCLLNNKEGWKIEALILTIINLSEKLCLGKPSQNKLRITLNTYLQKPLGKAKQDTRHFNDMTEGMKNFFELMLAK